MAGWTNKGKAAILGWSFRDVAREANLYVALLSSGSGLSADTNLFSELTEIEAGNGYTTGGYQLTPGTTDFDTLTENDADNKGQVKIKDVSWTASEGSIPDSGDGALYAVLTDDNLTVGNRYVYAYWSLSEARSLTDGQILTLEDLELSIDES